MFYGANERDFYFMNGLIWWIIGLSLAFITLLVVSIRIFKENSNLKHKYSAIIDIDEEVDFRVKLREEEDNKIGLLRKDYKEKYNIYQELTDKIELLQDSLDMCDIGLYEPHFHWRDAERYKIAIMHNRDKQKLMVKNKEAVTCAMDWTVGGSKKEGRQMVQRYIKLMLKAFNGECDSLICNVRWNNIKRMEERMTKAFTDINKLGENVQIKIAYAYLKLKQEELWLTFEHEQKKQEEKEEQRAIREQIREEEKLQKEIERKQKEIEKQEKEALELQKLLEQARKEGKEEAAQQYANKLQEMQEIIDNGNRRLSEAQKTKVGHIYVISNIGSFGENVYKIGMTRRLEPQDRVDELGDASVPFKFDVHAMIKSNNAPELEHKLHELFKNKSVNRINYRKEFFRVSLDEIEQAVKDEGYSEIEFTKVAEAQEYNETLAIIKAESEIKETKQAEKELMPESI